ncbi:hypothetical protein EYF80_033723 [Liparis tanakae]|uniref:Uncharacterized protein n=1 Tax=Liparis tanakae TaxID=230148 RepID=A0A4Z2GTN4_9TELE|nr:hypothetical protein EYF80_033723 [Liparis tanakae]
MRKEIETEKTLVMSAASEIFLIFTSVSSDANRRQKTKSGVSRGRLGTTYHGAEAYVCSESYGGPPVSMSASASLCRMNSCTSGSSGSVVVDALRRRWRPPQCFLPSGRTSRRNLSSSAAAGLRRAMMSKASVSSSPPPSSSYVTTFSRTSSSEMMSGSFLLRRSVTKTTTMAADTIE